MQYNAVPKLFQKSCSIPRIWINICSASCSSNKFIIKNVKILLNTQKHGTLSNISYFIILPQNMTPKSMHFIQYSCHKTKHSANGIFIKQGDYLFKYPKFEFRNLAYHRRIQHKTNVLLCYLFIFKVAMSM